MGVFFYFVSLVDELRCSLAAYVCMHIKCLFLCLNEIVCLVSAQTFFCLQFYYAHKYNRTQGVETKTNGKENKQF
jgi:hypothetical protein